MVLRYGFRSPAYPLWSPPLLERWFLIMVLLPRRNILKININTNYQEGCHAFYWHLGEGLGIKIFKSTTLVGRMFKEYVLAKYLEPSGVSVQALAYGRVRVCSPLTGRWNTLPCIWMHHIEGITLDDVLQTTISDYFGDEKNEEHATSLAYDSPYFFKYKHSLECALGLLADTWGIHLCDHLDNLANVIIDQNGKIWLIDFSIESFPLPRKSILTKVAPYLNITVPPEPYYSSLIKMGIITD